MTTRNSDILFMTEYIQNVLYFATIRQGKLPRNTSDTHFFCIDNELVYENYYSDFGPLNLGCVYKYCKLLNEKLKTYLNKQTIVHYTSIDPKKKANAAYLLGCFGVLYLSLQPNHALKPLLMHGQCYRPFQDATQGESRITISLMDCLQGIAKARDLGFFNFQDFNLEDYERLDRIQGGDLNWIIPGKFLAFIGPVDYSVSLYHPPEMYIDYFLENNVKIVIRLNKKLYDDNTFTSVGIKHYNLFFPDGSCPRKHILFKFLQISEESDVAIAVHCKAGLGRTGTLIGCYLIKHYRMTAREAIAWMRICRPGSVIGHQQEYLEELEAWLTKQGNLYRKRIFQDVEQFPKHQFGIYSIAEKTHKQRPVVFSKSPSPPPPIQRQTRSELTPPIRPQASKTREENKENEEDEVFITSCDLTVQSTEPTIQLKGCIIKSHTISEENGNIDRYSRGQSWRKYICCEPCTRACSEKLWKLAVRCTRVAPNICYSNKCCALLDTVSSPHKTPESEQFEWHLKLSNNKKITYKSVPSDTSRPGSRRSSGTGAGEPRPLRSTSRTNTPKSSGRCSAYTNDSNIKNMGGYSVVPTIHTAHSPIARNVCDAKNILMQTNHYNDQKEKQLSSAIKVTPQSFRDSNMLNVRPSRDISQVSHFSSAYKEPCQPQHRRRLGRSPSPPVLRMAGEQSRATNTPLPAHNVVTKDSKFTIKEALSKLKLSPPRNGSIGAASLGARRDAPSGRRAPSVRSDERPLATQGDMLNSIKFQRRLRDTLTTDKICIKFNDNKNSMTPKEKSNIRTVNSKTNSTSTRLGVNQDFSGSREKPITVASKGFFNTPRPSSPKGRRSPHPFY